MSQRILVINPNSNDSVTRGMDTALQPVRRPGQVDITCHTLDDAPFGIETDDDIDQAARLVVPHIAGNPGYSAYVIACYSDPGLDAARRQSDAPVYGIQESAVALCATHERRFGVLALGRESIQRHIAYVRALGMHAWHAGERPIDVSVDQAANDPRTLEKIVESGRQLIEEDGAEYLVLGCAGMAAWRKPAQRALGVPVIDPVLAAVTLAVSA